MENVLRKKSGDHTGIRSSKVAANNKMKVCVKGTVVTLASIRREK
ncbi:hypothetical protein [Chitinophaga filiformis]|nr:hypothetical protein [Chitinophaga filiformis]